MIMEGSMTGDCFLEYLEFNVVSYTKSMPKSLICYLRLTIFSFLDVHHILDLSLCW
jgi:hypothetical protein